MSDPHHNRCAGVAHFRLRVLLCRWIFWTAVSGTVVCAAKLILLAYDINPAVRALQSDLRGLLLFLCGLAVGLMRIDHWNAKQFKAWSEGCKEERGGE